MEAFFKDRSPKLPGGPRLLTQAIESFGAVPRLRRRAAADVDAFLKKY